MGVFFNKKKNLKIKKLSADEQRIENLLACIDKLIADNPELQPTQEEINALLSTTLDPSVRIEIIFMLMADKLGEMKTVLEEVRRMAQRNNLEM